MKVEANDFRLYEYYLLTLIPMIKELNRVHGTKMIWLSQYRTDDHIPETGIYPWAHFADKVDRYNEIAWRILKLGRI